jgi:hypothetical protein
MKAARIRLIVTATAFVGWLGFLGYLALGQTKPIVLSHSQLLVATHVVQAEVALDDDGKPSRRVIVKESYGKQQIAETEITIDNIKEARLPGGKPIAATGSYLLPLERIGLTKYRLVGSPSGQSQELMGRLFTVYPWNAEVERQLRDWIARVE